MSALYEDIFHEAGGRYVPVSCHTAKSSMGELYYYVAHWHEHIEIMLITKGSFILNIDGHVSHVTPGDLVVINSRDVHSTHAEEIGSEMIVLKFDPRILCPAGDNTVEYKYVYPFLFSDAKVKKIFRAGTFDDRGISERMVSMERDFKEKPYAYEITLHMNSLWVFLWLLEEWKREGGFIFGLEKFGAVSRFTELFNYVTRNPGSEITTEDAAKICSMSYGYFCRTFKEASGMTFKEYLNYTRLTRAQQLLLTTVMNITECALAVGFADVNYFIRKFRQRTGTSPSRYRRSFKTTAPDEDKGDES